MHIDLTKTTKSCIQFINAPRRFDVPEGQSSITHEPKVQVRHDRPIGFIDKILIKENE